MSAPRLLPRDGPATGVRVVPARLAATLAVMAVALIWGSSHLVAQTALREISVPLLLALRFSVAALLLVRVRPALTVWRSGAPLGGLFFAVYAAHTHGLTGTTAPKAAFVMGASALFVPLLGWAAGERPRFTALLAAALGLLGLGVLLLTGPLAWAPGDAWQVLAAGLLAVYTLALARATRRHPALDLTFTQLCVMAACAWLWAAPDPGMLGHITAPAWWSALYLGVCANVVVMLLQTFALRLLPPARVALWLLLEPVFAVALAALVGGGALTPGLLLGGGLVLLALGLEIRPQVARPSARSAARRRVRRVGGGAS